MLPYELTLPAEEDLKEIARYTLTQWGKKQSLRYAGLLEKRFREIASKAAIRAFRRRWPFTCQNGLKAALKPDFVSKSPMIWQRHEKHADKIKVTKFETA